MTPKEEQHVHLEECIRSLNEAWGVLQNIRTSKRKTPLHAAAFRYALVAYARPYTRSDGKHKKGREAYLFPTPQLTTEELALHKQILDLRHQVLAHSDLNIKQASVYVGHIAGQVKAIVASNSLPLFSGIDVVINLIERTLDSLYAQRAASEVGLPQKT